MPEVICRAAGLLVYLPWARPWHVPGTEAVTRRRDMIPAELFEAGPGVRPLLRRGRP